MSSYLNEKLKIARHFAFTILSAKACSNLNSIYLTRINVTSEKNLEEFPTIHVPILLPRKSIVEEKFLSDLQFF